MSHNDWLDRRPKEGTKEVLNSGPFIGIVVDNLDPDYMGSIRVQLMHEGSNGSQSPGEIISARYMSAYWGNTGARFNGTADTFQDTQKAWGLWSPSPAIGTQVIVIFIEGSSRNAFYIGATPDKYKNFMVPGAPATTLNTDSQSDRLPVAEFNSVTNDNPQGAQTDILKPKHLLADVFTTQGTIKDDTRGITSSGARREQASRVFGISTPGPTDYTSPKKSIGDSETSIETPISTLGGSTFVMDDGDHKYVRKTTADEGPPEYVKLTTGSGESKIPHNELVRIRTRTGHQILLHNSEDLIYIGNAKGTTWIELTSNGKIDIYAKDSISVHTETDLNFTADRDINFNAKGNINLNATEGIFATAAKTFDLRAGTDGKIQAVANLNLRSAHHIETAGVIDMNGPAAAQAVVAKIPSRVPTFEPWPYHENLNPTAFTKDKTVAVAVGTAAPAKPAYFNKYTTSTDTFNKGAK